MIYHILIDRFNGGWTMPPENKNAFLGGTLKGITEKMDYIHSLGATSIWLSPFFKTDAYHGYHTLDYEQIDPHFGSWDDLKILIDTAHKKGIRVIADFVPNHCHANHPFFQDAINNPATSKYRKWFYFTDSCSANCLNFYGYPDLPKFNLENPETAAYFIKVGERLAKIGIDGFRIDHAVGLPFEFLRYFRDRMHDCNPQTFVFGEVWADNMPRKFFNAIYFRSIWRRIYYWLFGIKQERIQLDYYDVLDGVLDFEFQGLLVDELKKGKRLLDNEQLKKKLKEHFAQYPSTSFQPVLFLDNHDTDRFLYHCKGDLSLLEEAIEIMKRSALPYVLYYGTERKMYNQKSIVNAEPYADLRVREPMAWESED